MGRERKGGGRGSCLVEGGKKYSMCERSVVGLEEKGRVEKEGKGERVKRGIMGRD